MEEAETQNKKIEETVIAILKDADLEEATEYKVRAMAAERLGLDLSDIGRKWLVRRVLESYLLSLGDDRKAVAEEQTKEVVREQETKRDTKEASDDTGRIICKLAEKRAVSVHDFKGTRLVSIRDYYKKDGKLIASARGISLNTQQWSAFRKRVPDIEAAVLKMESRIRSKDSEKQIEADVSNPVPAVTLGLNPAEMKQSDAEANAVTSCGPLDLSPIETKPVISNSSMISTFAPQEQTPMETKQPKADIPDSSAASAPPGFTPMDKIVPQGLTSMVSNQIGRDISNSVVASASMGLIPIQTPRLNGKNYHCWMHLMEFFLNQLKVSYVLTEPCPSIAINPKASSLEIGQARASRKRWLDDDYVCSHMILNSLSDHLFDQYSKRIQSAKELWEELKLAYDEDFGTKRSEVNKYVHFQMVDGISILEQVQELHKIANSITASGMWIDENFHVSVIVSKLPPSWNEFRMKLMQEDFLPLNMLMHRLKIEEECRNHAKKEDPPRKWGSQGLKMAQMGESMSDNKIGLKKKDFKRPGMHQEIEEDNKGIVCYNCGKKGHIWRYCHHKKVDNKENRNKENEVVPIVSEATVMEDIV